MLDDSAEIKQFSMVMHDWKSSFSQSELLNQLVQLSQVHSAV